MARALPYLFAIFLFVQPAAAETIIGQIVAIQDGDTLTILDQSKHQTKIRLAEIDAPEKGQPYGTRAKQELSALAFAKLATVDAQDIDRYGRTVGRITVGGMDVNAELVKRGAAWVYRKYNKDLALLNLEQRAREARIGLWALPEPIPPWEWRKSRSAKCRTSLNP